MAARQSLNTNFQAKVMKAVLDTFFKAAGNEYYISSIYIDLKMTRF